MRGRWPKLALLLALIALLGHFGWEWQHAGHQTASVRLVPPLLPEPVARLKGDAAGRLLIHDLLDPDRGRLAKQAAVQASADEVDLSWHLYAVAVQQVHAPVAVILAGAKVISVSEGDLLPDGSRLVLIIRDGVVVEKDGKEKHVYLFGKL